MKRGRARTRGRCRKIRYGCFALPRVPGARMVAKAKRRDVTWFARTEPATGKVEFSESFAGLLPEGQRYIIAHEQAHLETGPDHDARFYAALKRIAEARGIDWKTAWQLETFNLPRSAKRGH